MLETYVVLYLSFFFTLTCAPYIQSVMQVLKKQVLAVHYLMYQYICQQNILLLSKDSGEWASGCRQCNWLWRVVPLCLIRICWLWVQILVLPWLWSSASCLHQYCRCLWLLLLLTMEICITVGITHSLHWLFIDIWLIPCHRTLTAWNVAHNIITGLFGPDLFIHRPPSYCWNISKYSFIQH